MEIAGILLLAVVIEGFITFIFPKKEGEEPRSWVKYISLIMGVGLSIAYDVDILATFGLVSVVPLVGAIVSGLIIGRGSNYVNDFFGMIRGFKQASEE